MTNDQSTVSLHTTLLSAMLGTSIGLAIDRGVEHASIWVTLAIVALVLHAVNFYHGKTVAFYDINELIRTDARPMLRGTLVVFNALLFLVFCVMAARIYREDFIIWGEIALRAIDIVGVAAQQRLFDRSPGSRDLRGDLRAQLKFWQVMNFCVLLWFVVVMLGLFPAVPRYPLVAGSFFVIVAIDLYVEYTAYSGNYFRSLRDWNALAERWDRMQGLHGDRYRVEIIHPFVREFVVGTAGQTVVDLGSGNGCTARWLAAKVDVAVLGFDSSRALLDIAGLYQAAAVGKNNVKFVEGAIDSLDPQPLIRAVTDTRSASGPRLAFVSLFGAQDCADLCRFFTNLKELMKAEERVLLIFESLASFDPNATHSVTVRTWKYSWNDREKIQVVSWLPVATTNPTSVFAGSADDPSTIISLITHQRNADDFISVASPLGFRAVRCGPIPFTLEPTTPQQLAYRRQPKFEYLEMTV